MSNRIISMSINRADHVQLFPLRMNPPISRSVPSLSGASSTSDHTRPFLLRVDFSPQ